MYCLRIATIWQSWYRQVKLWIWYESQTRQIRQNWRRRGNSSCQWWNILREELYEYKLNSGEVSGWLVQRANQRRQLLWHLLQRSAPGLQSPIRQELMARQRLRHSDLATSEAARVCRHPVCKMLSNLKC